MRRTTLFIAVSALLTGLLANPAAAQGSKLYRWVDEDGKVHYTQTPPPDLDAAHDVYSDKGRRMEQIDDAKSQTEIDDEQAAAERLNRIQRLKREERERLQSTYNNVADITRARSERLEALDIRISSLKDTIAAQISQLQNIVERAGDQQRRGSKVSEDLQASVANIQDQIRENQAFLNKQREIRKSVADEFRNEIDLYRALVLSDDKDQA